MGLNKSKEEIRITIVESDNYEYAIVKIHIRDDSDKVAEIKLMVPKSIIKSIEKKLNNYNGFAECLLDKYQPLGNAEIEKIVKRLREFL